MISIFLKHHIYEMCIDVIFDGIRKHFTSIKPQDFDIMRLEQINKARMDDLQAMQDDMLGYMTKNIKHRGAAMKGPADELEGEWDEIMKRIGQKVGMAFPK